MEIYYYCECGKELEIKSDDTKFKRSDKSELCITFKRCESCQSLSEMQIDVRG
jgi:hypothetical protein